MLRSRVINAFGGSLSGVVLVIVIITKFTKGAYLVLIAMPILSQFLPIRRLLIPRLPPRTTPPRRLLQRWAP